MATLSRSPARPLTFGAGGSPPTGKKPRRSLWVGLLAVALLPLTACSKDKQPTSSPPTTGVSSSAMVTTASASSSPPVTTASPSASSSPPTTGATTHPPSTHSTASSASNTPTATPSTSTPPPPSSITGLLGKEWTKIPTGNRVVALTFDAGANADGVPSILATLSARGVPASFFLTGNWVNDFPSQARQIAARYRVGNHSVNHPHFTQLTDAQIRSQLADAAGIIKRATSANPAPWFRFPYGDRDSRTISVVNSAGYVPIGWTVDTLGWEGTSSGITSDSILQRVLGALAPGEIVLMHVGSHPKDHSTLDAATLPRLIDALRARGYGFVTLDAMLR